MINGWWLVVNGGIGRGLYKAYRIDGQRVGLQWVYSGSTVGLQWVYSGSTMNKRWCELHGQI